MDYRKVRADMRVRLKNGVHNKMGTIRYVYQQEGRKFFDIIFDGEDFISCRWCCEDRKELYFDYEEYKEDFKNMLLNKKDE